MATLVGIARERTVQGLQVHGTHVRRVRELPDPAAPLDDADGQATALPGVAAVVLTADCLPVALVSAEAVAMLHAGWRGLAAARWPKASPRCGSSAPRVRCTPRSGRARAPAATRPGPRSTRRSRPTAPRARRGDNADLKHVARRQLREAGVDEVYDVGLCTLCAPPGLFFSHRRDGEATGRQAAVVWREPWPS